MSAFSRRECRLRDGTTIVLRQPDADDAAELIRFVHAVAEESPYMLTVPGEFAMTEQQERQWLTEQAEQPGRLAMVAEVDGAVVGMLSVMNGSRRRDAHSATFGVSIRGAWRSRGIGTAMILAMLDWARANPLIDRIGLSVFAANDRAIVLYRRLGFIEEGRRPMAYQLEDGRYCDEVMMYQIVRSSKAGDEC